MTKCSLSRSSDRSKLSKLNNYFFKRVNILFLELHLLEFQFNEFQINQFHQYFYLFIIVISKIKRRYVMYRYDLFLEYLCTNSQWYGS